MQNLVSYCCTVTDSMCVFTVYSVVWSLKCCSSTVRYLYSNESNFGVLYCICSALLMLQTVTDIEYQDVSCFSKAGFYNSVLN